MVRKSLKWARRLAVLGFVAAVFARVFGSRSLSHRVGTETIPTIGGDTWPPVPTNPDRQD